MKSMLMASVTAVILAGGAQAAAPKKAAPTPAEAIAFVNKAEADLEVLGAYSNRASWVRNTMITDDTEWLEAKANAEQNAAATRLAKQAAHFNAVKVDAITRRKLDLLKRSLVLPAPDRPGAAAELATLSSKMGSTYSTGKFVYKGKAINLDDAETLLAETRTPADAKALWEGWHSIAPPMKADYVRLVALANEGSRGLGYKDTGALWRSGYDMDPDAFARDTDRLWTQVEPFYKNLHCYVRARLNAKYGDAVQPRTGPIRADLLGNMWAQSWGEIYDVVAPKEDASPYDLNKLLVAKGFDQVKMVKTGENFYSSLGFAALPDSFWKRSMLVRPADREVVCHASAWDVDAKNDIRMKACLKINAEDFYTVHHELGHNYYQRAYSSQPYIFKDGANDGFHEAIGDFAGLSALTPTYLNQIGVLDKVPGHDGEIPFLMKMALDKIAFLPFALLVDKWRWQVFSGEVTPAQYNDAWWALRTKYQGITPPGPRPADAFDPAAKFHVADSTPYTRYFLAYIYEFQFHRAACQQSGWKGPLSQCSVYGQKAVGEKLNKMLAMGQSKPWPDAMEAFTGGRAADASAIIDYFAPLDAWLVQQNSGQACGW